MPGPGLAASVLPEGLSRSALEVLPLAVVVSNRDGEVVFANAHAQWLLGDGLARGLTVPWMSDSASTLAARGGATLRRATLPLVGHQGFSLSVLTAGSVSHEDQPEHAPVRRLNEVEATAQVGSWSWDVTANVVTWSDELYRMYGLVPQSIPISYESYIHMLPAEERERVGELVGRCLRTGEPAVFTHLVRLPDGDLRWHQSRAQTVMVNGRAVRMFGTAQDITERVRTERALRESLEQAQRLAEENESLRDEIAAQLAEVRASRARIVQAGDDARKRLERDLHDGAQQRFTTLGLILRSAQSRCASETDPELGDELGKAIAELQAGLAELRTLARGLHPKILTDEGLVPAVRALVARSPLPVKLEAGSIGRLPAPVETATYFVVSEALTNVAKHASASSARVTVQRGARGLVVEVDDDGCGGAASEEGSGLSGLSDRVAALDGRLDLHGLPGGGTRLRVELPCG